MGYPGLLGAAYRTNCTMTCESEKASVIDYWRAVELFSPQTVPRVAPNDSVEPVFSGKEDIPLPWDVSHPLSHRHPPPHRSRRFFLYCGVFSLENVKLILEDKLGKNPEIFDERPNGETCLFALSVTDEGCPLFDTFILSSCSWATARTVKPGPNSSDWLIGFEATVSRIASDFAERYAIREDDERGQELRAQGYNIGHPLGYADILCETKRIAQDLGIANLCENVEIRIKAGLVASRNQYSSDDQDFLNSFFIKDLGKVATEVRNKNLGKGLSSFLAGTDEVDPTERADVRKSINTLFHQLSPTLFSPGRWPSKGHHPLVFSQQFAINSITQKLMDDTGIFAVNGPPGTGKTTLLRDLIAAVVVQRANRISELVSPDGAFSGEKRWKVGDFTRVISIWKEEFRGFEIVVASNNNGAVENVSLEIPGRAAIDPSWISETDYFPEFATRLIGQSAWGLIGARLGNKANRNRFMNQFWYKNNEEDFNDARDIAAAGFLNLLRSFEGQQPRDWKQAVSRFKEATAEEQRIRKERENIFRTYLEFFSHYHELTGLLKVLSELTSRRDIATQQLQTAKEECKAYILEVEASKQRRLEHRQFQPSILEILFTLGKAFRIWHQKDKLLEVLIEQAENKLMQAKNQIDSQNQDIQLHKNEIYKTNLDINQIHKMFAEFQDKLSIAKGRFGRHFPVHSDWFDEKNEDEREKSSPWADEEWNAARTKVFLEALQLQKAFIFANAGAMRKSLHGAMDILSGNVPDTAPKDAVEAAWTTFFFVIPIISTTFASFDRLFSHLGRESIGWLLIDEAGQAVPQSAVGAIWRSKRSVVVGDPLQLEPVVTIPLTVQESLRKHYQVEDIWIPGISSVQQLADRISQFGTYVATEDDPIWVGSPLRVHRRCDQPMFDISNKIAYDGLMVFGTPTRPSLNISPSGWIDC